MEEKYLKKRIRKKIKSFFLSTSCEMDPHVEHMLTQAKQEEILGEKQLIKTNIYFYNFFLLFAFNIFNKDLYFATVLRAI